MSLSRFNVGIEGGCRFIFLRRTKMGATTFEVTEVLGDKKIGDVFNNAVENARFAYGHAGYTGTLAEKNEFVVIKDMSGKTYAEVHAEIRRLSADPNCPAYDKWGPAGAITFTREDGKKLATFFGSASC
jgi:hypothetical protein